MKKKGTVQEGTIWHFLKPSRKLFYLLLFAIPFANSMID